MTHKPCALAGSGVPADFQTVSSIDEGREGTRGKQEIMKSHNLSDWEPLDPQSSKGFRS